MTLKITTKNTKIFLYKAIFYISLAIVIFIFSSQNLNLFSAIAMVGGVYFLLNMNVRSNNEFIKKRAN